MYFVENERVLNVDGVQMTDSPICAGWPGRNSSVPVTKNWRPYDSSGLRLRCVQRSVPEAIGSKSFDTISKCDKSRIKRRPIPP